MNMRAWVQILPGSDGGPARGSRVLERPLLPGGVASLLLLTIAFGCQPPPDHAESAADAQGPEALVARWVEMWNSYDLDQVRELFLDDERLTYFSSEREGVIRGMDALLEHHRGFGFLPGGDERDSRLWVEGLRADLLEEVAVLTGIWYFQPSPEGEMEPEAEMEPDAETEPGTDPQRGPVTFVCVKDGGGWRFTHMNFSEYLPPESS